MTRYLGGFKGSPGFIFVCVLNCCLAKDSEQADPIKHYVGNKICILFQKYYSKHYA